jgi:hypothetical protein
MTAASRGQVWINSGAISMTVESVSFFTGMNWRPRAWIGHAKRARLCRRQRGTGRCRDV